ncbi:mitochondrial glycerol-3-phosphate dehydrogenase [Basidiobolus ranarum]|uniref:Glycerol-3-phosphate dehydrogenase n=1 Tax=Basidiobolus ranarum TaxID=34480 RepID=A0ABR2WYH9_9FUNG
MWARLRTKPYLCSSLVATGAAATSFYYLNQKKPRTPFLSQVYSDSKPLALDDVDPNRPKTFWSPPNRQEVINQLKGFQKDGSERPAAEQSEPPFDLLIVGGGATGTGVALDAATRGLKVALVERDDFASGTSSRSTKLVHGGVRYLEKAFMELDYEQYKLVTEALHERATFLKIAPYLSYQLPIMLPVYKWWQLPYYWVGCKFYDIFAGKEKLESSYVLGKSKALEAFPMLKEENLVGALVYYDGQHNDSRMNVTLALTAAAHGAVVANHVEVVSLVKEPSPEDKTKEVVRGAIVRDTFTGEEWTVKAKGVINATGPFTDGLRKMDEPKEAEIVAPSAGVHIILPNYYSPQNMGLLDPATTDGRVIFFLPWQGNVIAGTTDSKTEVTANPLAQEEEIAWILEEVQRYLSSDVKVRRSDVLAAWSGIRPLVRDPSSKDTASLVRNHMINVSDSNLVTIAGGKWTTYRSMAEETIDKAIEVLDLKPTSDCLTETTQLLGSHGYSNTMFIRLIQHFGLETEVAQHLASSYGDRAWNVAALAESTNKSYPKVGHRLNQLYPYIEAEIVYAVRNEYACTAVDVLARRTRLAFLNAHAALESLPRVIEIMAQELNWDQARKEKEYRESFDFLKTMGLPAEYIEAESNEKNSDVSYNRQIPTERSGGGV